MTYEVILSALADPTRRAVLDQLRDGAQPVGRIAAGLPVSRPAVSQHLKVLLDAGLVSVAAQGTRNLYKIRAGGAADLEVWLGALRVAPVAATPDATTGWHKDLTTRLTPAEAWKLFCDDLAIWWPVARVSLSARSDGALPQVVILDAVPGGTLREVLFDGSQGIWATVTAADRPLRLDLDWRLGTPEGSAVTVLFQAERDGTRVTLHHDVQDVDTKAIWTAVLERFDAAANASLSNF